MKFINNLLLLGVLASGLILTGCDKSQLYPVEVPPAQAHFLGAKNQIYSVLVNPAPVYRIVVGTTDVSNQDRVVTYNITSASGAVEGTDFTVDNPAHTLFIPAGKTLDTIEVTANFNSYPFGVADTLLFSISEPSVTPATFQDTVRLVITGPSACSEAVVTLSDLLGDYTNTIEVYGTGSPYGPYTTSISSATSTGPTSATIVVENIYDYGWGPISFNLDWSNPSSPTTQVVDQNAIAGADAGDVFGATYAGQPVAVRAPAGTIAASAFGSYSYCGQTLVLNMQLGIFGVGWGTSLYQVTMER